MVLPDSLTLVRLLIEFGVGSWMLMLAMGRRRSARSWHPQAMMGGALLGFGGLSLWELSSGGNRVTLVLSLVLGIVAIVGVVRMLKEFKREG